jgi:rhomboid family GlyGly-CTERM serine protease
MITKPSAATVTLWGPPLALLVLIGLLEALRPWVHELLSYQRGRILDGELWRLLSGNLVHLGAWHAFLNGLGVLVFVLLCPVHWGPWGWLWRLGVLGLGMSLGLLFLQPQLDGYVGLSGVIHGLFLLGLWPQVRRGDLIAGGCLLYLIGKLGWELYAGAPVSDEAAIGGRVIVESHLYGSLTAGLLLMLHGGLTHLRRIADVRDLPPH